MALRSRLKEVMAKLGKKNAEYASLKVDVDREHLPYQIKNKQLEVFFTFLWKTSFVSGTVCPEAPNKDRPQIQATQGLNKYFEKNNLKTIKDKKFDHYLPNPNTELQKLRFFKLLTLYYCTLLQNFRPRTLFPLSNFTLSLSTGSRSNALKTANNFLKPVLPQ